MLLPDARPCLGCGAQPLLRYCRAERTYLCECGGCDWNTGETGSLSKAGELVRWHRDNKPSCDFTRWRWLCRYAEITDQVPPPIPEYLGGERQRYRRTNIQINIYPKGEGYARAA